MFLANKKSDYNCINAIFYFKVYIIQSIWIDLSTKYIHNLFIDVENYLINYFLIRLPATVV